LKILINSLYFYPDHSGIAIYSSDFAFYAKEQGHEVNVITGFSFYPNWKKKVEDRRRFFSKEKINGVNIYRGYTYVPIRPNTVNRLLQELGVFIFSTINYLRVGKPDCIVVFTTPVSFGLLGTFFKKIYKTTLLINVQDFQVEAAASLNMVKSTLFVKLLKKVEYLTYKNCDYVSSISESMCQILEEKVFQKEKVFLWPNWISISEYPKGIEKGVFRLENNINQERIIVAYAGNIGLKQGLEILVDVAEMFKTNAKIEFLIIGDGAGLQKLKNYATKKQLDKLRFLPFLDEVSYKHFLEDVDVVFISQQKTEKDIYFPSKLLGLMAVGKTILVTADPESELFKILNNNGLALASNYGDVDKICQHLESVIKNPSIKSKLSEKTREFVRKYDREIVLSQVLNKIDNR
jgi:colanic acid biosynthesis glycosyl transferase WcaI